MKTLLILIILISAGCSQKHISVAQAVPEGGATAKKPGEKVHTNPDDGSASTPSPSVPYVFFWKLRTTPDGSVTKEIAFLPDGSETTTPFSFPGHFEEGADLSRSLAPWKNGALYLHRVDGGHTAIASLDFSAFNSEDLITLESKITAVTAAPERGVVAWTTSSASVYVASATDWLPHHLNLHGVIPHEIHLNRAGILTVSDLGGTDAYSLADGVSHPKFLGHTAGVGLAYATDSDKVAALIDSGNRVELLVRGNGGASWHADQSERGSLHRPYWSKSGLLGYWQQKRDSYLLKVANPQLKTVEVVAEVAKGRGLQAGDLCLAWAGDTLYFSAIKNGQAVIESAERNHGAWKANVFADSIDSEDAYVCPATEGN